jgi:tRNA G37 N-methylase Trm5
MQTLLMNSITRTSHTGNSRSLEILTDNHFTHHHHHLPDARKEEEVAEEAVEEEEEMAEADYLLQRDQACSHCMDELLTLNF